MPEQLYTNTGDGWLRSGMVRFFEALEGLMVPIDSVQPHPENNNNGDEDVVRESVLVNGMYRPVQVQESTGYVLAGNTTWTVVKSLGAECIPVVRLPVNDYEALRILYVDNAAAAQARIDEGLSLDILKKIYEYEGTLEGTGATMSEMEIMEAQAAIPLDLEPDPYEGWLTLSAQVSPEMFKAFIEMTEDAEEGGNRHRLEYLMRLAGWDGGYKRTDPLIAFGARTDEKGMTHMLVLGCLGESASIPWSCICGASGRAGSAEKVRVQFQLHLRGQWTPPPKRART